MALDGIRMACKQRTVLPKVLGALSVLCCAGEGDAISATKSPVAVARKLTKNEAGFDVFVQDAVPNHNCTAFHFLNSNVNYHAVL